MIMALEIFQTVVCLGVVGLGVAMFTLDWK